jgi:GTPase Era involved in 16S rRNA processing
LTKDIGKSILFSANLSRILFGEKMSMEKHRIAQNQLAVQSYETDIFQDRKTSFDVEEIIRKKSLKNTAKSPGHSELVAFENRFVPEEVEKKQKTKVTKEKGIDTESQLCGAVGTHIYKCLRNDRKKIMQMYSPV